MCFSGVRDTVIVQLKLNKNLHVRYLIWSTRTGSPQFTTITEPEISIVSHDGYKMRHHMIDQIL